MPTEGVSNEVCCGTGSLPADIIAHTLRLDSTFILGILAKLSIYKKHFKKI